MFATKYSIGSRFVSSILMTLLIVSAYALFAMAVILPKSNYELQTAINRLIPELCQLEHLRVLKNEFVHMLDVLHSLMSYLLWCLRNGNTFCYRFGLIFEYEYLIHTRWVWYSSFHLELSCIRCFHRFWDDVVAECSKAVIIDSWSTS